MRRLIGLAGPKGAGKDTTFDTIKNMTQFPVKRFAFGDALKEELHKHFKLLLEVLHGTQELKDSTMTHFKWNHVMFAPYAEGHSGFMTYREVMQIYGTEIVRRSRGPHYWTDRIMADVHSWLDADEDNIAIITDVRFANEAERIKADGGAIVLVDGKVSGESNEHSSESTPIDHDFRIRGKGKGSVKQSANDLKKVFWSQLGVKL